MRNVTQEELQVINYVKQEDSKQKAVFDVRPVSFISSQYHIIFVYPRNLTVLSNITQEVVHSKNFAEDMLIRNSVFDVM